MTTAIEVRMQDSRDTRAWIAVILSLLLAEVGMHELGHLTLVWGGALGGVLLAAAGLAGWMHARHRGTSWLLVAPVLVFIAVTLITEALGVALLPSFDLSAVTLLGTQGPDHGLLGMGHLLADVTVLAIGAHQLVRWIRLRSTGTALGAAAAFTACCGTTAVLLAPAFAALGSTLGLAGIHVGDSLVVVAAVFTAAVAALGFALSGVGEPARATAPDSIP